MVRKNPNIEFPKLMPKGMIIGLSASICTTILGSCIGAWLLHSERIAEENLGYITLLILLLSSVTGGLLTIQTIKTKRLLSCLVFG
jgi:putative membrane protein (TIGR04086 family)